MIFISNLSDLALSRELWSVDEQYPPSCSRYNGLRVTLAFKLQSVNETKTRVATDPSFSSPPSTPSNDLSETDMGDIVVNDDGFTVS